MSIMTTTDWVAQAKDVLTYPSDFGYFGSDDTMWTTSAPTITKHRDSNNRENAAFDIAWETLCQEFPDLAPENNEQTTTERPGKFYIFGASHWAVGWIEQIVVPVLKKPGEITPDNIHDAFIRAGELAIDFPHLDGADERADEKNWADVERDIASWQKHLAERQNDPYIAAFPASELVRHIQVDEDNYMPGDEDSIPYSWYYSSERENQNSGDDHVFVWGLLDLHAAACWDEAHQEIEGQQELPDA